MKEEEDDDKPRHRLSLPRRVQQAGKSVNKGDRCDGRDLRKRSKEAPPEDQQGQVLLL